MSPTKAKFNKQVKLTSRSRTDSTASHHAQNRNASAGWHRKCTANSVHGTICPQLSLCIDRRWGCSTDHRGWWRLHFPSLLSHSIGLLTRLQRWPPHPPRRLPPGARPVMHPWLGPGRRLAVWSQLRLIAPVNRLLVVRMFYQHYNYCCWHRYWVRRCFRCCY